MEDKLLEFGTDPRDTQNLRNIFRHMVRTNTIPEYRNPYYVFLFFVRTTSRALEMEEADALKGGFAKYVLNWLNDLEPPEEFAQEMAWEKSQLTLRIARIKVETLIKLIRTEGLTKEQVDAKKSEIGWGRAEQLQMEFQLAENHRVEREALQ